MERIMEKLKQSIRERKVILFVGSGLSATLGLPTWQALIDHIAGELGYDERLFQAYEGHQALAEYYEIQKGGIGELTRWMRENWSGREEEIFASGLYRRIVELDFPIIYTTNYDHCLETAFQLWNRPYQRIVRVEDFLGADPGATQIVKFHGDMDVPESIVMSERSYFGRFDFESPLDIKLRADMLGRSLLFVGYSLTDVNLRYLVYKLNQLWEKGGSAGQRPPSYICLYAPNPIQQAVFRRRGIHVIVGDDLDKARSLQNFFARL